MSNSFKQKSKKTTKIRSLQNNRGAKAGLLRTDMAAELLNIDGSDTPSKLVKKSKIEVDTALSKKIKKPIGTYITLESGIVKAGQRDRYKELSEAIGEAIAELVPNKKKIKSVLVVCLGNPNLTADALGARVFESLNINRHLPAAARDGVSICALCPNVMGATGIESFDIIKGVVERVKPQLVIAVDSLASAAVNRIASAFQLCSSGITPGSGVANHRIRLDKSSLEVDVLSLGVPLVVYATTIINEAAGENAAQNADEEIRGLIVTPKDIDLLVEECAKVIASGINRCFLN